jgi:signal transduction histidine kinase
MTMQSLAPHSIRHRIMMAFLLVIVSWGIVLTLAIDSAFSRILRDQNVPPALAAEISRHFILVCSGLTLIGFVLFYFIARYLAQAVVAPVQQLMVGVEALHQGNLGSRVPVTGNDEFAALATAFNRMAEQLGEIDRLKSEFVSTVSHELRTPLASIVGYAELLQGGGHSPEESAEYLDIVNHKADELATLVEGLLDLSRIEAGLGMQLQLESFDLVALVHECLEQARYLTSRHRFDYDGPSTPFFITADPLRLKQVLDNLLGNAVKYSSDGTVAVSLAIGDDSIKLVVSDQGVGMSEEQRAHACDKFYRANASNTAVSGAGLGLSIVRSSVLAHHGTLSIDSQPGVGTRVSVILPHRPPPAA